MCQYSISDIHRSNMTRIYPRRQNNFPLHTQPTNFSSRIINHVRNESTIVKRENATNASVKNCWQKPPEISIVGVSQLRDASQPKFAKLMWACVICICVGVCIVQLRTCTEKYLAQLVVQHVNIIRDARVKFPALYICPGTERNLHHKFTNKKELDKCKGDDFDFSCFHDPLAEASVSLFTKAINNSISRAASAMWNATYLNENSVLLYKSCKPLDTDCTVYGRPWKVEWNSLNTFWGGCFVLNTVVEEDYHGPFTYFDVAVNNSFHNRITTILTHRLNNSKNETEKSSIIKKLNGHNIGLLFHLYHEFTTDQHHFMYYTTQDVLQGFHTQVAMRKKEYKMLNRQKSRCVVADKIYTECHNECVERNLTKKCRMPYSNGTKMECGVVDYRHAHVMNHQAYSTFDESKCGCQPPCITIKYIASVDVMDKIENEDEMIRVRFYFADNSHEVTTEEIAYGFTAFLSDVGGSLGCLVGFCTLNVPEIMGFFIYYLRTKKK